MIRGRLRWRRRLRKSEGKLDFRDAAYGDCQRIRACENGKGTVEFASMFYVKEVTLQIYCLSLLW